MVQELDMFGFFKLIIMIQLFWALGITLLVYSIPTTELNYISIYTSTVNTNQLETIGSDIQGNLENQINLPLVELGAIIFYSGNLIIDLMINFFTAVPQIFSLLLTILFVFMPIDVNLQSLIITFFYSIVTVLYFLNLLSFLSNFRSGGGIK